MDPERPVTLKSTLSVAAGFAVLAAVMTWPLVLHFTGALPNDLPDPTLNTWVLAWDADRLLHGLRGLWTAPVLYPYSTTLAHTESLLGIAFFTAPVNWMTGSPVAGYNFAFLFSYVLAGVGMYLLAQELTGRRDAAILAGLAFAFSPFRIDHPGHLQVLMAGWIPVSLWGLHRYFRVAGDIAAAPRRRWLAVFGIAFLLQATSNGYYMYFLAVAVAIAILWELWRLERARGRAIVELAVTGLCMLLVFAPVARAYYSVRVAHGQERSLTEVAVFSAPVSAYWKVSRRVIVWRNVLSGGAGELQLFPGAMPLVLGAVAAAALVWSRRRAPGLAASAGTLDARQRSLTGLYLVMAAAAFTFSLGTPLEIGGRTFVGPYGWLLEILPGMTALRVTARIAVLVFLAMSALLAVGATQILKRYPRAAPTLAMVMGLAILAEGYSGGVRMVPFDPRGLSQDRLAYAWLDGRPPGGMLELPIGGMGRSMGAFYYHFAAIKHGHRIVNGSLLYGSPLKGFLRESGSPLRDLPQLADTIAALRSIGVRYLMVHRRDWKAWDDLPDVAATVRAIDAASSQIEAQETFDQTTVWQLKAWPPEPAAADDDDLVPVSTSTLQASAAPGLDRVRFAFDGNLGTRWLTGRPQAGNEWFEIRLSEPQDLARVAFKMSRATMGDYPRQLVVESSTGDGVFRTLYSGTVLKAFVQGLVKDGQAPLIRIDLPPNETTTLRLRQTGTTRSWHWSIPELELWKRK